MYINIKIDFNIYLSPGNSKKKNTNHESSNVSLF